MRPPIASTLSGLLWTVLALPFLLGTVPQHPLRGAFAALTAGPALGLVLYTASRWVYVQPRLVRVLWTVLSFYAAAVCLACIVVVAGTPAGSLELIDLTRASMVVCIGLTIAPPFQVLFVLAYFNHEWLRRLSGRGSTRSVTDARAV